MRILVGIAGFILGVAAGIATAVILIPNSVGLLL